MASRTKRWAMILTRDRIRQLWYAPILVTAMGLMMVRALIMAHLLDLKQFALFSGGVLISGTFCMLGCLGLQPMLQRELPVNLLRGQTRRGLVLAAQCNLVALSCSVIAVLGTLAGVSLTSFSSLLLTVGILHGLSQQMFLIATVDSRSRGEVLIFSTQNLVRAIAALSLGITVATLTGSAVMVLAVEALVTLALSVRLFDGSVSRVAWTSSNAYRLAIRRLPRVPWRSAIALMAIMAVGFVLLNADRWVAADRLSIDEFAQYSFAWTLLMIAQSVQLVINASMYPLLARRFASGGLREAFGVCATSSVLVLIVGAICFGPAWFVLRLAVRHYFPLYVDVVELFPLFIAVAVLRVSDFWSSYLLIIGREVGLLALNVCVVIVGVASWMLLMRSGAVTKVASFDVAILAGALTILNYMAAAGFAFRASAGRCV